MTDCYICSKEATVKITYIDCLDYRSTEKRCPLCAKSLKSNENNTVVKETILTNPNHASNNSNFNDTVDTNIIIPHSGTGLIK
jgi:hypothetical protein